MILVTGMVSKTWRYQRLDGFEKVSYKMTRTLFLGPAQVLVTIDDDLYKSCACDNQVKTMSSRKADKEGYCAGSICNALLRVTLCVHFRRRGESQTSNTKKLLEHFIEMRGELLLNGLAATVDRRYGSMALLRTSAGFVICGMRIML